MTAGTAAKMMRSEWHIRGVGGHHHHQITKLSHSINAIGVWVVM
jgi:hypothetical protein